MTAARSKNQLDREGHDDPSGTALPPIRHLMPLGRPLTIALVMMVALATTLAVVAQDRALNRDLESAAAARQAAGEAAQLRDLAPDESGDFLRASIVDQRLYAASRAPPQGAASRADVAGRSAVSPARP